MVKKTFNIEGMHCTSCSKLIEMELEEKVNSIKVDFDKKTANVDFNPENISEKEIKEIINEQGFKVKGGN